MKYLRLFEEHSDYEDFIEGEEFFLPNVSYCQDEINVVHFNPIYDPYNGHSYVDLGLPSGTMWATMNVGAQSETDYGLYFAWGETEGYTTSQVPSQKNFSANENDSDYQFAPNGYDWNDSVNYGITKYNVTDNKTVLDLTDDAASVIMGGEWHMPSLSQLQELKFYTTSEYELINNIPCVILTSTVNDETITIPAYGQVADGYFSGTIDTAEGDPYTCLWSNELDSDCTSAYEMDICDDEKSIGSIGRYTGITVRGVIGSSDFSPPSARFYNGDNIIDQRDVCFSSEVVHDEGWENPREGKRIGYYNCDGSYIPSYAVQSISCGQCDKIEIDMFNGGISNLSVDVSHAQDSGVLSGGNYEYEMDGNIFRIVPKTGKWNFACFLTLYINFTYENEQYSTILSINNCD